jgi:hypothetical protein
MQTHSFVYHLVYRNSGLREADEQAVQVELSSTPLPVAAVDDEVHDRVAEGVVVVEEAAPEHGFAGLVQVDSLLVVLDERYDCHLHGKNMLRPYPL